MMNITKSLIQTSKVVRPNVTSFINISTKLFAKKNSDGSGKSDREVDKSKKTVPTASTNAEPVVASTESAQAETGNVVKIDSTPGNRVN